MNSLFVHFLLLVLLITPLQAQHITVSGRVTDLVTAEALPYASVAVRHSPLGTIANAGGAFTIHLPSKYAHDTLWISMIGYEAREIIITAATAHQALQIRLKRAVSLLPEVIVRDTLTPLAILQRAHARLKDNYINVPFRAQGFYREVQKDNGRPVSLVEAAVDLYNDGYRKGKETVKLNHLRKSKGYENPYVSFWERKNLLLLFIEQNYARGNAGKNPDSKKITQLDDTSIDGVPVYVLQVEGSWWPAVLYIRCDNYAIIRAEERYDHAREGQLRWKVDHAPFIASYPQRKILRVDYTEHDGKYYARTYLIELHILYKNAVNDELLLDFNITQQFVVTDITTRNVNRLSPKETLSKEVSLKKLTTPYDSAFWAHYNISPLDTAIQRDLEQKMPLEAQFRMP